MTINNEPYFLKNKEWYYFDEKKWCYVLTKKAPLKAVESYKKYYKNFNTKIR